MVKTPVIDIGACNGCESCIEICPVIFRKNDDTGLIEVADPSEISGEDTLEALSEAIREAITLCPSDCITFDETE